MTAEQEIERVVPFLAHAREDHPDLVLSLDTWRSEVARVAGRRGGPRPGQRHLGRSRPATSCTSRRRSAPAYVVSHTGGLPPRTDPVGVTYGPEPLGVVARRAAHPGRRAPSAPRRPAYPQDRMLIDPTLDFGKTTAHSLEVLRHTARRGRWASPCCRRCPARTSSARPSTCEADDRLEGTLAATAVAAWLGATVFRAHDVRATRRVVDMVASIRGDRRRCWPCAGWRGETHGGDSGPSRCRAHPARWTASGSSSSAASGRRRSRG